MQPPAPSTGRFDGATHLFPVRVYWEDTDATGVVYHASYIRWFERARSDMLRLLGIDQRALREAGSGGYAVSDLAVRYLRPALFDDVVVIRSSATEIGAATCRIAQAAWRGEELLADGSVRAAYVAASGRPTRQPREWLDAFAKVLAPSQGNERQS